MIYAGSQMFHECAEDDHARCKSLDLIDECKGVYASCSCTCHEAVECASFNEERGSFPSLRERFLADVEQIFGGRIGT